MIVTSAALSAHLSAHSTGCLAPGLYSRCVAPSEPHDGPRYLDSVSSEPLHPVARETLLAALDHGYADPLRLHRAAREARLLLDNARAATAEALGVREDEVSFTGSGTRSVHLGVLGLLGGLRSATPTLAHSAIEHSAVAAAGRWWEARGAGTTRVIPVDDLGHVSTDAVPAGPDVVVAVQQANQEIGTLQDLDAVAAAAGDAPLFVDACAAAARVPLPRAWSAAALSAHKWGGPAGVGILLVRRGARWRAPFPTDDRVDHRVSGFENVPAVLAAAAALQARVTERETLDRRQRDLTTVLRDRLAHIDGVEVHGDPDRRLPHLVSFSCLYVDGEALVGELDRRGLAVASGSACTSSALEPSHVLRAIGALTHGNVRLGFPADADTSDVDRLLTALPEVLADLRARLGGPHG